MLMKAKTAVAVGTMMADKTVPVADVGPSVMVGTPSRIGPEAVSSGCTGGELPEMNARHPLGAGQGDEDAMRNTNPPRVQVEFILLPFDPPCSIWERVRWLFLTFVWLFFS